MGDFIHSFLQLSSVKVPYAMYNLSLENRLSNNLVRENEKHKVIMRWPNGNCNGGGSSVGARLTPKVCGD